MVKSYLLGLAVVFCLLALIEGNEILNDGDKCLYMWHTICRSGYCKFNTLKHVELNLLAYRFISNVKLFGICAPIEERPSRGESGDDMYNVRGGPKAWPEHCDHHSECTTDYCQDWVLSEKFKLPENEWKNWGIMDADHFHPFCNERDPATYPTTFNLDLNGAFKREVKVVRGKKKANETCTAHVDCEIGFCVDNWVEIQVQTPGNYDFREGKSINDLVYICQAHRLEPTEIGDWCIQTFPSYCRSRYCKVNTDAAIKSKSIGDVRAQLEWLDGKCASWEDRPWKHMGEHQEMVGWRANGQTCARHFDVECQSGHCSIDIDAWKKVALDDNGLIISGGLNIWPNSTCSNEKKPYFLDSIDRVINNEII